MGTIGRCISLTLYRPKPWAVNYVKTWSFSVLIIWCFTMLHSIYEGQMRNLVDLMAFLIVDTSCVKEVLSIAFGCWHQTPSLWGSSVERSSLGAAFFQLAVGSRQRHPGAPESIFSAGSGLGAIGGGLPRFAWRVHPTGVLFLGPTEKSTDSWSFSLVFGRRFATAKKEFRLSILVVASCLVRYAFLDLGERWVWEIRTWYPLAVFGNLALEFGIEPRGETAGVGRCKVQSCQGVLPCRRQLYQRIPGIPVVGALVEWRFGDALWILWSPGLWRPLPA